MPAPPKNANDRLPPPPWLRPLAAALLVFLSGAAALELFWRALGYTPSPTDDMALWAQERARLDRPGEADIAILGRSRILQGFVPEAFAELAPRVRPVQLAVGAWHPLAALRDIALHSPFDGLVVVELSPESLLPELWEQQQPYVAYYHAEWGPTAHLTRRTKNLLQAHLVLLLPDLLLHRALPDLLRGAPPVQFLWNRVDRMQTVDYDRVDLNEFTAIQLDKITANMAAYAELPGYRSWRNGMSTLDGWVRQIRDRGGDVVFLRMPTSGEYRALEEKYFPRSEFWDSFAANTAAPTVHFEDIPGLRDMVCAEGTHLHREDAKKFSQILARLLLERNLLPQQE